MKTTEESLGYLLNDVARLIRQEFHKRIASSNFTQAQARVLVHVSRNEGIRQVALAELLEIQPITLARMIDQLQQHGLIERRTSPSDRRAYELYLTPAAAPHLAVIF
jgi:DNA-binding MarR family transcriptional regulator